MADDQQKVLQVSDLMTADPLTVKPGDSLEQVYNLMDNKLIRHVPVVNDDGELEGLISQRDLIGATVSAMQDLSFSEKTLYMSEQHARDVMTTEPATTELDMPASEAAGLLLENKYGCLPVVEGLKLVGILTESDFVKLALKGNLNQG